MRIRIVLSLLAAGLVTGCSGGGNASDVAAKMLHGGEIFPLPEDRGFVEIVNEAPKTKTSGKGTTTTLVLYFIGPDKKSALATKPKDVSVKVGAKTVPLREATEAGDPSGSARFASEPGPYDYRGQEGTISASLDGQSINIPFRGR